MPRYAAETTVPIDRTMGAIRKAIMDNGATRYAAIEGDGRYALEFDMLDRTIRFTVVLPAKKQEKYRLDKRGYARSPEKQYALWDQDCRTTFRAVLLVVKAKFESVAWKIETFEQAFYSHMVLPNGLTLYEATHEAVERAIAARSMNGLLALTAGEL